MKKTILLILMSLIWGIKSYAQNFYISVPGGGNWANDATWDRDGDGLNVGTDGIPGANDIAVIIGDNVGGGNISITSSASIGDLYVQYDNQNVLQNSNPPFIPAITLTINGQLVGFDYYGSFSYAIPTTTVIENDSKLNIVFTGDNIGTTSINPAIYSWSSNATLKNVTFNPTLSSTNIQIEDVTMNASTLTVSNGTLTVNSGFTLAQSGTSSLNLANGTSLVVDGEISGFSTITLQSSSTMDIGASGIVSGSGTLNVQDGSSLTIDGAINGGSTSTNYGSIVMSGAPTVTIGNNGYLNSDNFTFSSGSTLNIANNQPDGWWHSTSAGPTSVPVPGDYNFTVNYNRFGDQGILPANYGNLNLTGSGIKTLSTALSGLLKVHGDLTIQSTFLTSGNPNAIDVGGDLHNDGTWVPTQNVNFNGTSAQSITGGSMVSFGGGMTISNTAGVSLLNQDVDINSTLTIDASTSFNPNGRQVTLSGNLANSGSLVASGTFVFDGTTAVSGSGTNAFENVTISGSVSAQAKAASISGNFVNNGTIDNLNGTVDFNGNTNQSISGTSTTNFYNLNISNGTATVSNTGTANLMTAMTLSSGATFSADGGAAGVFTIVSTSGSNTARINAIPSDASVTGNVVAQRYFDGGGDVWRNFGVYVNGATLTDITDAGFSFNVTGNDMASYDETVAGSVDNGWVLRSSFASSNLSNNYGYSFWTMASETPRLVSFHGTLNQQSQSIPITYTNSGSPVDDGWNLVNNPFPSTVDWDLMTRNGSVSGTVAVWNTSTASYDYWNGSTGNLTNGLIASGQGFWVQTNGVSPTLTIPESAKAASNTSFLKTADEPASNVLIVALSQNDKIDRTYIHFREDATDGFDNQLDGRKLTNGIFNISTLSSSDDVLAINSVEGLTDCQKVIKVNIFNVLWDDVNKVNYKGFVPGQYQLSFDGFSSFTNSLKFDLVDYYQGGEVITPMEEGSVYDFSVDTTQTNSWGDSRFEIRISGKDINPTVEYNAATLCNNGTSVMFTNSQFGVEYEVQKDGNAIVSKVSDGSDFSLFIPQEKIVDGNNTFDILLKNGDCSSLLLNGALVFQHNSVLEVTSVEDGKNCGSGRVLISASGAQGNGYYKWYESLDAIDPIAGENGNEYLTPEIETSKFYYVSIVNESGCESTERIRVQAEIVNLDVPIVNVEGDLLSTDAIAESYQWYKDEEPIPGETDQSITVSESGAYSVEIISNGCSSLSQNRVMEILGLEDLKSSGIRIYPNPVRTILNIDSDRSDVENIMIYDINGSLVYQSGEVFQGEIDMTNVRKGIYIVNIVTKNQIINYRIQKK